MKKAVYPKLKLAEWTTKDLERDLQEQGFDMRKQIQSRMDDKSQFVIYEQQETPAGVHHR